MNLETLRAAVESGRNFSYLLFYGHKPRSDGRVGSECLSQWYGAGFELDGVHYPTAEHRMMAGKAEVFGDELMREQILAASGPSEAKKLGRQVRDFDDKTWKAHRFDLVVEANIAKFEQNPALRAYRDPRKWRGQNLLGFALMKVRTAIMESLAD